MFNIGFAYLKLIDFATDLNMADSRDHKDKDRDRGRKDSSRDHRSHDRDDGHKSKKRDRSPSPDRSSKKSFRRGLQVIYMGVALRYILSLLFF